jgi:hypothetical protein
MTSMTTRLYTAVELIAVQEQLPDPNVHEHCIQTSQAGTTRISSLYTTSYVSVLEIVNSLNLLSIPQELKVT